ncbi:uncharacterized transporter slc-17.2-like [Schistocerca piceifrons]|uniref:uncharacterized transporter slc-17.2-like n=1 Tax=Schistocerca piceifrons TaxID=274613 RepID=UPI001F5F1183|nr:uncharacterized transporter slc-17.2-like [Schistocerca piceifrons]
MGLAISFMTRVNISVAIVDMVNETALEERALRSSDAFHFGAAVSSRDDPDVCPGKLVLKNQAGGRNGEFAWDKQKQGEILAAFYYGYAAGHIPGGLLADRFGGRIVFGIGIFLSSLLTVLTPISAWTDAYLLFANRVGQGFTQQRHRQCSAAKMNEKEGHTIKIQLFICFLSVLEEKRGSLKE